MKKSPRKKRTTLPLSRIRESSVGSMPPRRAFNFSFSDDPLTGIVRHVPVMEAIQQLAAAESKAKPAEIAEKRVEITQDSMTDASPVKIVKQPQRAPPVKKTNNTLSDAESNGRRLLLAAFADELNAFDQPAKEQDLSNMALSLNSAHFRLPMNLFELETMMPLEYLEKFCFPNPVRGNVYKKLFNKHKPKDGSVAGAREVFNAIKDMYADTLNEEEIRFLLGLIQFDLIGDRKLTLKLFSAIAALSERVFYHKFVTEETIHLKEHQKDNVETTDFECLKWKFRGIRVYPSTERVLLGLSEDFKDKSKYIIQPITLRFTPMGNPAPIPNTQEEKTSGRDDLPNENNPADVQEET